MGGQCPPEDTISCPQGGTVPAGQQCPPPPTLGRSQLSYAAVRIPEPLEDFLGAAGAIVSFGTRGGIGHTTQSSSVTSTGFVNERTDFAAEYDTNGEVQFTHTRRTSSRIYTYSTKDSDVFMYRLNDVPAAGWKGVETWAEYPTGHVYWDAYSNIENADYSDYLTLGYWLIAAKDTNTGNVTGYTLGAAASGNYPFTGDNLARLTGRATYEGPATGLYVTSQGVGILNEVDYFNAKASLTAEFGDEATLGSISGAITEGMTDGGLTLPELTLGSANITDSFSGGNFRGDTSGMTDSGVALAGAWGGKFFVDESLCTTDIPPSCSAPHPLSVAGTFGAKTTDDLQSILGAFGADVVTSDPMPDPMPDPMSRELLQNAMQNAINVTPPMNYDHYESPIELIEYSRGGRDFGLNTDSIDHVWFGIASRSGGTHTIHTEYDENGNFHVSLTRYKHENVRYPINHPDVISISSKDVVVLHKRFDGVPAAGWKGVEIRKQTSQYSSYAEVFSDMENNEDTDYLTLGTWLLISTYDDIVDRKDLSKTIRNIPFFYIRSFAKGNDPFISDNMPNLEGTATYEGPSTGLYMSKTNATATPTFDNFNAIARLTANFGSPGPSGSGNGVPIRGTVWGTIAEIKTDGGVTLPEATFSPTEIGRWFDAGEQETFGDHTSGRFMNNIGAWDGNWYGQFIGNGSDSKEHPRSVVGTFNVQTIDGLQRLLGSFGAHWTSSQPR